MMNQPIDSSEWGFGQSSGLAIITAMGGLIATGAATLVMQQITGSIELPPPQGMLDVLIGALIVRFHLLVALFGIVTTGRWALHMLVHDRDKFHERADKVIDAKVRIENATAAEMEHRNQLLADERDRRLSLPPAESKTEMPPETMTINTIKGSTTTLKHVPPVLVKFRLNDGSVATYNVALIDSFFATMSPNPARRLWKHDTNKYADTARFIVALQYSPLVAKPSGDEWEWAYGYAKAIEWWRPLATQIMDSLARKTPALPSSE